MGLGFHADNTPRFYFREAAPDGQIAQWDEWREISAHEGYSMIENAVYETDKVFEIRVEPIKRVSFDYIGIPYSAFGRFRERLWQQIRPKGKPVLGLMQGFMPSTALEIYRLREGHDLPIYSQPEDYKLFEGEMHDWWHLHAANWDDVETPLRHLIHHSDCDGDLSPEQCREVAPALREAVSSWNEGDYEREFAENLANAMDICAENNRRLIFS